MAVGSDSQLMTASACWSSTNALGWSASTPSRRPSGKPQAQGPVRPRDRRSLPGASGPLRLQGPASTSAHPTPSRTAPSGRASPRSVAGSRCIGVITRLRRCCGSLPNPHRYIADGRVTGVFELHARPRVAKLRLGPLRSLSATTQRNAPLSSIANKRQVTSRSLAAPAPGHEKEAESPR